MRLWSIHQEASVATLRAHHNVCSVQFSPDVGHLLAAGSVDHKVRRQRRQRGLACVDRG